MKVVYSPNQVADTESFSPSASKPRDVMADWQRRKLPIEIVEPSPTTVAQLMQAHDRRYVEKVLDGSAENGFGNKHLNVRQSLPYTVGAMVTGAIEALQSRTAVCAPVSGFHHARYSKPGGYCTFNGLIVAAFEARKLGAEKIGILDLDMHYGDGTDEIIDRLRLNWITHYTAGEKYCLSHQAQNFFAELPSIMERFRKCDLLLLQLGADPYVHDPFGGWLTIPELFRRDREVFKACREMALPVVWDLAGGYARDEFGDIDPVLRIHRNSALACIEEYEGPIPMKVKCIDSGSKAGSSAKDALTIGKVYEVIKAVFDRYIIVADNGEEMMLYKSRFEVVDG